MRHRISLRMMLMGAFALGALSLTACSDAETPDAYFDAGGGGGVSAGRDEPCINGRCGSDDLICVSQGTGDDVTLTCRALCDDAADDDPCGFRSTCRTLENGQHACLPAGLLDEGCPCDEGFSCVNLDGNVCKTACLMGVDGGPDDCPAEAGTCYPFRTDDGGTRDDGVCLGESPNSGGDVGSPDAGSPDGGN